MLIERGYPGISIKRQCELLGLSRSSYYYEPLSESSENLHLMSLIDKQYLRTPFYGVKRMTEYLRSLKYEVNPKRVRRLMREMGIEAIYSKPNLSKPDKGHKIYPYLLKGVVIDHVNQVWSSDITYIQMIRGYLYLVAVIDVFSRYVLSWELSNSLECGFCITALESALRYGKPEIFNTDQGSQFTSKDYTNILKEGSIRISMDGRGRAIDNVFIERLWRSLKYEDIYLKSYETAKSLYEGLKAYFEFYNNERFHQGLKYKVPAEIYFHK
jgi:putative transposase